MEQPVQFIADVKMRNSANSEFTPISPPIDAIIVDKTTKEPISCTKNQKGRSKAKKVGSPKHSQKTRAEELREAAKMYRKNYFEKRRLAVARYSASHLEVNRKAVAQYSVNHPEKSRTRQGRYIF
jgi:hypothetical protein